MRCAAPVLSAAILLAPVAAGAEVMVRVASDQVDIDATAAPLSDVLDRLARQTGMEVVYEGTPPRQPITLALQGRSSTEAVLAILEGQGLNYALVADPTGSKVQTLIIAGVAGKGTSVGSGSSSRTSRSGRRNRSRRPAPPPVTDPDMTDPEMMDPEMMDPEYDDMEEEDPFELEDPSMLMGAEGMPLGGEMPMPGDDQAPPEGMDFDSPAEAPVPAAGPMPFPGGQQVFPASPFTPQPQYPQPVAPRPPGSGPDDASGPAAPPP